jgi:hypothetical protein
VRVAPAAGLVLEGGVFFGLTRMSAEEAFYLQVGYAFGGEPPQATAAQ